MRVHATTTDLEILNKLDSAHRAHYEKFVVSSADRQVPGGGLMVHEANGGHTILKHVGRDIQYLRNRILIEGKSRASSFYDRKTAEKAITEALELNKIQIDDWIKNNPGKNVYTLSHQLNFNAGTLLVKGSSDWVDCNKVKVVLLRDSSSLGYRIETAYLN